MYVKDFDGNGAMEQVISIYNRGVAYPLNLRDDLVNALPFLQQRLTSYKDYARATFADVFHESDLAGAQISRVYTFATSLALNNGDGSFTLKPLADEAQLAPVYGILATDVNHDGRPDLLLAGNFDGFKPEIGRMAGSYGMLLLADSTRTASDKAPFGPVEASLSGFVVPGQSRDVARVRTARGDLIVVARNNDRPLIFRVGSRGQSR